MKKINYENMEDITVINQEELDAIPNDFPGNIYIYFGTRDDPARISKDYVGAVMAIGNSCVIAEKNSSVKAYGKSTVKAVDRSSVSAYEYSNVEAHDYSDIEVFGNGHVNSYDHSRVCSYGNSKVYAFRNTFVVGHEDSYIISFESINVEIHDNCAAVINGVIHVETFGNSMVEAFSNCTVKAYNESKVIAHDNCTVVAHEDSIITADMNAQVIDQLSEKGRIDILGNARILHIPRTAEEYCSFNGIEHDHNTGRFLLRVHKRNGLFYSDQFPEFVYEIGEKTKVNFCKNYIPVRNLTNRIDDNSMDWVDLSVIEVEVDLDNIVIHQDFGDVAKCSEVTVLREVPLAECGMYGEILSRMK